MICEQGLIQAASSIGQLFTHEKNIAAVINFGCAGSLDGLATFCCIDSISFFQEKDYLPTPFRHKFTRAHLETKLELCSKYKKGIVFDMEGWASIRRP